jgi:para-nitrobenzyl esterase
MLAGGDPAGMEALSGRIRRCWIDFIRDGAPGPDWPHHDPARRMTMRLDTICEAASDPAGLLLEAAA